MDLEKQQIYPRPTNEEVHERLSQATNDDLMGWQWLALVPDEAEQIIAALDAAEKSTQALESAFKKRTELLGEP